MIDAAALTFSLLRGLICEQRQTLNPVSFSSAIIRIISRNKGTGIRVWLVCRGMLSGAAFLLRRVVLEEKEELTLKGIPVAYFGVALLGFITEGNMLLGLVHINEADRWLHLGLAMAMVVAAIGASRPSTQFVAKSHA